MNQDGYICFQKVVFSPSPFATFNFYFPIYSIIYASPKLRTLFYFINNWYIAFETNAYHKSFIMKLLNKDVELFNKFFRYIAGKYLRESAIYNDQTEIVLYFDETFL